MNDLNRDKRSKANEALCNSNLARLLAAVVCWSVCASSTFAQRMEPAPPELRDVGIEEHTGVRIPLDLTFIDSNERPVKLADLFDGEHPVILTLNYSNCPMLCSLQLNGLVDALKRMNWQLGGEYRVVTVSIDPKELPVRARMTKQKYLKLYGRGGVDGWRFLTGEQAAIRKLADTVGFHYTYVKETNQYAHAAAAIILSPDGMVSRYLYGVEYDPQTIRLSLVEAAEGKVGSPMDQIILFCFHYDAAKGRYGPAAQAAMRVAAVVTIIGLAGVVLLFWRKATRSEKKKEDTVPSSAASE